jgi:hypothetical protein
MSSYWNSIAYFFRLPFHSQYVQESRGVVTYEL